MKKNTISVLLLLAGMSFAFGQTASQKEQIIKHTNVQRLNELAAEFSADFYTRKATAERLAAINNWPLEIRENGGYAKLMDVTEDGKPVYWGISNVGSAITSRANTLQPGGSTGLNLKGSFQDVGVWDGEYPRISHVDITPGRVISQDAPANPIAQHPTHVLGTILGSGTGNANARGIAYDATGKVNNFDNDLSEMATQAGFGLILSNHSYGLVINGDTPSALFGSYVDQSRDTDELMYEAPYYTAVFAAGNDGNGSYDRLTSKQTAKNTVVVAAVNQVNNYTGPSSVTLASFSNWGPTNDKRVKPDISSKGTEVFSCSDETNTSYATLQGTSMAAPGVTGVLVLLQEHYSNVNDLEYMRSATVRGLVAHSADEAGDFDGPDPRFGWGLLNAQKAADVISKDADNTSAIIEEKTLLPGQTYTKQVLAIGTEPLVATLSWTDPAGDVTSSSAAVLVNDLDIRIEKSGTTYYPWKLPSTNGNAAIKGDNTVDNIEKIEIASPVAEEYTITISHKSNLTVPSGTVHQDYSLIVSGASDVTAVTENRANLFSVWPNPASTQVSVSLSGIIEPNASAVMFDVQGRQVKQTLLTSEVTGIDVSGISKGVYFVKVTNGTATATQKLVIK